MNPAYDEVISASDADRGALFAETAARLGTPVQNVEKDFWVCWTLDALFNGLEPANPRLLFKGGTSLSKAFGLIPRFSEDIDISSPKASSIDVRSQKHDLMGGVAAMYLLCSLQR